MTYSYIMAQGLDLYSILNAYANKNNSPYIDIKELLSSLENSAKQNVAKQPEWEKWISETTAKFWAELNPLAKEEKLIILADTDEGRIFLPSYYTELIRKVYQSPDAIAAEPFPNEDSLGISLPEERFAIVNVDSELGPYLEQITTTLPPDEHSPQMNAIVKLIFPDGFGAAIVLSSMFPRRVMETAFLKFRHYLRKGHNKEYALQKLYPHFLGKDKYLREMLEQIIVRPMDCITNMENYGEYQYLFWAHFCTMLKTDVQRKKEKLNEDWGLYQAAALIESCNVFFKERAVEEREKELAFKSLDQHMEKSPYYYTLDTILKFTNDKGVLLLGQYSQEELSVYIKRKTAESEDNKLPEWFAIQGKTGERCFVLKSRLLHLCGRLLIECRLNVKQMVIKRWAGLIKNNKREASMENDQAFDILLGDYTASLSPLLAAVLENRKLQVVYLEMEEAKVPIPPAARIFSNGRLQPMSALFVLKRKDLLTDAKMTLPFWYTFPLLAWLFNLFLNAGKKKKKTHEQKEIVVAEEDGPNIQDAIFRAEQELVPPNHTLDSYLRELEGRWATIIDNHARQNLLEDVQTLVRDHLRYVLRARKQKNPPPLNIKEMSGHLIVHTMTLQSIKNQDALNLYVQLYMIKQLKNARL